MAHAWEDFPVESIPTPHGPVVVTLSAAAAPTTSSGPTVSLLLIHGNSSSSRVFYHLLAHPPRGVERVVAMDLPGHGRSPDTTGDPATAYTQRGYAESAAAVCHALGVAEVIVLGWSLGGHVAIELVALVQSARSVAAIRGVMLVGTPPATGRAQFARAFDPSGNAPDTHRKQEEAKEAQASAAGSDDDFLGGRAVWSDDEYAAFAVTGYGPPQEPWMIDTARRTDGRARKIMIAAMKAGTGVDQCAVVATSAVPCAVVNGGREPFINLDYVDGLTYKNLWEQRCHRIPGLGHAPFWEQPAVFREYLERFVADCVAAM